MRILVVEDEAPLREQLQSHLTAKGYSVDVAEDGEEGLYFGREYPLDIVVIDLGLPKLSGIELIRQLRAENKKKGERRRRNMRKNNKLKKQKKKNRGQGGQDRNHKKKEMAKKIRKKTRK